MTARRTTALAGAALIASMLAPTAGAAVAPVGDDRAAAAAKTRLTFTVDDCEGCEISLISAKENAAGDGLDVWQSKTREVVDGEVTFKLATKHTWGLSANVVAPWEGGLGYVTNLVWRYNGEGVGDAVSLDEAVTKRRASACWEGTRQRTVTVPIVVEEVEVDGVQGRTPGTIAYVPTTESWLKPMRRAYDGVIGSQDVNVCR